MYEGQAKLRSEIQGWYLHPYGPPSGTYEENSEGIQSLPYVQAEMISGQNNLIVSEVGYCAKDINEGKGCNGTEESTIAASNLSKMLGNAKPYHEAGWLKALLVYSRNAGGWAMQYNGGELTAQGKALEGFAKAQAEWTIMATPNPKETAETGLSSISCTSTKACMAVGSYKPKVGELSGLREAWNGTEWTRQPTLNSEGASLEATPYSVSCASVVACVAVGAHGLEAFSDLWSSSEWKVQITPHPAGASISELLSVSCSSSAACTAVGFYKDGSGVYDTLAERWNGSEWQIEPTPSPMGATESRLTGVSCASATACTAVGSYKSSLKAKATLVEVWNGVEWAIQPSPSPAGAKASSLFGVSCTSPSKCVAVGESENGSSESSTLAEANF